MNIGHLRAVCDDFTLEDSAHQRFTPIGADLSQQFAWAIGLADVAVTSGR